MLQVWGTVLTTGFLLVAGEPAWSVEGVLFAVGAGTIGTAGLGCMFLALSRSAMGLVSPLSALLGAAIPAVIGIASGDPITLALALGMGDRAGRRSCSSRCQTARSAAAAGPAFQGAKPVDWLLVLGAGLGAAGFFLFTDQCPPGGSRDGRHADGDPAHVPARGCCWWCSWSGSGRSARRYGPGVRVPRVAVGLGLVASVGDLTGTVAYLAATAIGTLSVTVVLVSLFPVSTALLARVVLHERLSRVRIAGVGLAVAGAALIGVGELAAG